MDNLASPQRPSPTAADYKAAIDQMLEEIKRLNHEMQRDGDAIRESKARTKAMLAQLRTARNHVEAAL